jgi:hypothetical protein
MKMWSMLRSITEAEILTGLVRKNDFSWTHRNVDGIHQNFSF